MFQDYVSFPPKPADYVSFPPRPAIDTLIINEPLPIADKLLAKVNILAEHLGTTSETFYDIFYAQNLFIKGMYTTALGLVFGAFAFILFYVVIVKYKAEWQGRAVHEVDGFHVGVMTICAVGGVIAVVLSVLGFFTGIPRILNPEYYAIMELIHTLR